MTSFVSLSQNLSHFRLIGASACVIRPCRSHAKICDLIDTLKAAKTPGNLWSTEYCYFYTKLLQKMHLSIIDGHNCTESFVVHGHGDCSDVSFLEELLFVGIAGDVNIGHRTERAENFPNLLFRYVLSQIGDGNKNLPILIILT